MKKHILFMMFLVCLLLGSLSVRGQRLWQPTKSPRGYEVLFLYANNKELFAGLGGLGLYRSSDEGESWTRCDKGIDNPFPTALLETKDHWYAATLFGGVFRSADKGESWQDSNNGLASREVYALARRGELLLAGTGNGVYLSRDAGESWVQAALPYPIGPHQIIFSLLVFGDDIVAGSSESIYISSDDGLTWMQIATGSRLDLRVLATDGRRIVAGTSGDALVESFDGQHWLPDSTATGGKSDITAVLLSDTLLLVGASNKGVYKDKRNINVALPEEGATSLALARKTLFAGTYTQGVWKYDLKDGMPVPLREGGATPFAQAGFTLFPNPAAASEVTLRYWTDEPAEVRIDLYTAAGEHLRTLFQGRQAAGQFEAPLDSRPLAGGTYYCLVRIGQRLFIERLVVANR